MDSTLRSDPMGIGPAGDGDHWITPVSANGDSEMRLRSLLEGKGAGIRVRLESPLDFDVVGHAIGGAGELTLIVLDGDDDTEGHAISLHFPSLEEAKRFQSRMLVTGALVGTLVLASGGLALSQALPDAGTAGGAQAQVQSVVPGFASEDNMGGTQLQQSAVPGFASEDNMGGTQLQQSAVPGFASEDNMGGTQATVDSAAGDADDSGIGGKHLGPQPR